MKSCKDYQDKMSLQFDQQLSDDDQKSLQAHIAICAACKQKYELIEKSDFVLQQATERTAHHFLPKEKAPQGLAMRAFKEWKHRQDVAPGISDSANQSGSTQSNQNRAITDAQ